MLLKKIISKLNLMNHWLLPAHCVLCGRLSGRPANLCQHCLHDLPILPHHCLQCARFLPLVETNRCGDCQQEPPPFDRTYALFPYESPIVPLIGQFKFHQQLQHARTFAELFIERIQNTWYRHQPLPKVLIPVPLHPLRLRERGFNQALEIAKPIAKTLTMQLDYTGIQRIKATLTQSHLSAAERKINMAQAFAGTRYYTGLSVAVLDDVMTTAHTLNAFCSVLKQKGASTIDVWCCARRG
jgi:ComF family protein